MTQNIYDNPTFFDGYSQLDRFVKGLDGAPEWPSLAALLPDLSGRRVLDLGCGFGWFCRWAREQQAAHVQGIDVSEKMLERARSSTHDDAITYLRADLEQVELPAQAFDVVFSSRTLHYLERLPELLSQTYRGLVPGGHFVFSTEHPIFMAPSHPNWITDAEGHAVWPLNRYLDEGPRSVDWLAKGVIKQHRTIGSYLNALVGAGFAIAHVNEWGPSKQQMAERPERVVEHERPYFLLVAAQRPLASG